MESHDEIRVLSRTLQIAVGGTALLAGADKFFNLMTDWEKYLDPEVPQKTGISAKNFMRIVGIIEMAAGAGILRGYRRAGGYIVSAWLLGIVGNLLKQRDWYDIAARDVNMALEAFTLARLSEIAERRSSVAGGSIAPETIEPTMKFDKRLA